MACSIQITSVTGKRLPNQLDPSSVIVAGTAQECTKLNVTLRCYYPVVGGVESDTASALASVTNGYWAVEFLGTQNIQCKCNGSVAVVAACIDDPTCNAEMPFDLPCVVATDCPYVDDINIIIGLAKDPPCVDQPNTPVAITATAQGPSGPGNYTWKFSDGTSAGTLTLGGPNAPSVTHTFEFPRPPLTVELLYTPSKPGCPPSSPPKSKTINIPLCKPENGQGGKPENGQTGKTEETKPPPEQVTIQPKDQGGGSAAGCDALLWGAVGTALLGALVFAGGFCFGNPFAMTMGTMLAVLGLGLFFLWWAICAKISSCGVMQAVHCMLFWMVLATPAIGLVTIGIVAVSRALGYPSEPTIPQEAQPCIAAAAAFWGWVGTLYALLTWAMKTAGCAVRCP